MFYNYKLQNILSLLESTEENPLALASDPKTPTEVLASLADHENLAVQKALVSNPSINTQTFFKLAGNHPKEANSNPMLPLWDLENPNWHNEASEWATDAIVHGLMKQNPHYWGTKFANSSDSMLRLYAAFSEHLPEHLLDQLVEDPDEMVRNNTLDNPNFKSKHLFKIANDPADEVRMNAYYRKNYTPQEIKHLIQKNDHPAYLSNLAKHPDLSEEDIAHFVNHSEADLRKAVIENPYISNEQLVKLSNDPSFQVASRVFNSAERLDRKFKIPIEAYKNAANHPNITVPIEVANSAFIPPIALSHFKKHPSMDVKKQLIFNRNLNPQHLNDLIEYPQLHKYLASKERLDKETYEKIYQSRSSGDSIPNLARNPSVPKEILQQLSQHSDSQISKDAENTLRAKAAQEKYTQDRKNALAQKKLGNNGI